MLMHSILGHMNKVSIGPKPYMSAMPIVLVGASVGGKPNFMTAAWAGVACMEPPMVSVSINKSRHTEKGIMESETFSLNIPSTKNVAEADLCGLISGSKDDKTSIFEVFYSKSTNTPLIKSFPVNIECELVHTIDLGSHNLHVGKVIDIHADEGCLQNEVPDVVKVDPIIYTNGMYYRFGESIGKAYSIGKTLKKS